MSFNRLDSSDFIVSADAISAPIWSNNTPSLIFNTTNVTTQSVQALGTSGQFYLTIYQTGSGFEEAIPQFDIAYADANGSGSLAYNLAVPQNSPSSTIYGQYLDLILGDEKAEFIFGISASSQFFALSFERARYKETLLPGSLTLVLKDSNNPPVSLTDDSPNVVVPQYIGTNRIFNIVSGSAGNPVGTNVYGWLLPDIGTILINNSSSLPGGKISVEAPTTTTTPSPNAKFFNLIQTCSLNSSETITSNYIFIRARSSEFNYSENSSFISGSTGEVLYSSFINNPQTYITTIGLYNDTNELLAVAKLSRPLPKDFTSEALVRVKLDF
jgi:hypothetical protein